MYVLFDTIVNPVMMMFSFHRSYKDVRRLPRGLSFARPDIDGDGTKEKKKESFPN